MAQTQVHGLAGQGLGPQAAIGMEGVAVEIKFSRTAAAMDALENLH